MMLPLNHHDNCNYQYPQSHRQILRNKKYLIPLSIAFCWIIYRLNSNNHHHLGILRKKFNHASHYSDHLSDHAHNKPLTSASSWFRFNSSPNQGSRKSNLISSSHLKSWIKDWSIWSLSPSSSRWFSNHKNSFELLIKSIQGQNPADWKSPTPPLPIDSKLSERLHAWGSSPIPEPAVWVQFNLLTCPDHRIGKNANYDLLRRAHLMWATMNSTHIKSKREEMIQHLVSSERLGLLNPQFFGQGRGIVFTAGNVDTYSRVLLTVRMLREKIGCKLPVEIFSFPTEKPEPKLRRTLERLNVKFLTIDWAEKDPHRNKNFVKLQIYCVLSD